MNELERVLVADAAAAAPEAIVAALPEAAAHRRIEGVPRTIYEELWHVAFWQQISVDWVSGIETPYPEHADKGFPAADDVAVESWETLRQRFLGTLREAGDAACDVSRLDLLVRCPSAPGRHVRTMTIREQLVNLSAHNAYHLGRIVLMRQMMGLWPPPDGGFTW